jgi:hypothetical protein
MLVFLDESGDPGMKLTGGSSDLFIVTLVIFNDREEAQACDTRIDLLRRELRISDGTEFKFHKTSLAIRSAFLEAVGRYDFFYFGIVINKASLYSQNFEIKDSFYKYTCSLVFENAKPHLNEAIVVIDGSGSRDFRNQLSSYLKRRINDQKNGLRQIAKVKIQDSHRNNLLQLADMICGAVARSYTDKNDAEDYRRIISHREMRVQVWPK